MDMFSSKGAAGVGAAYASLSIVTALLRHLEKSGALIPADVSAILASALSQFPIDNVAAREDARRLIESLKK